MLKNFRRIFSTDPNAPGSRGWFPSQYNTEEHDLMVDVYKVCDDDVICLQGLEVKEMSGF